MEDRNMMPQIAYYLWLLLDIVMTVFTFIVASLAIITVGNVIAIIASSIAIVFFWIPRIKMMIRDEFEGDFKAYLKFIFQKVKKRERTKKND